MDNNQNQNNNINSQSQNQNNQMSDKEIKEAQTHEASKNVAHTLGKGLSTYYGGAAGNKLYDAASNTNAGQAIESTVGKAAETSPMAKPIFRALNNSGALDAANQVIDASGGKGSTNGLNNNLNNNMLKGSQAKSALRNTSNITNQKPNAINRGHNLVNPKVEENAVNPEQLNDEQEYYDQLENEELLNEQEMLQQQEALEQENEEKEKKKKERVKSIIKFLIENPIAMVIIIGIILLLVIMIWFVYIDISDYDLVGSEMSEYSDAETISGYCSQIILIKEHDEFTGDAVSSIDDVDLEETFILNKQTVKRWSYQTYDLETYVKGVVQAEAIAVNDEKTFEVAAIAARTYALQITNSTCYTWDNTNKRQSYRNPQNFTTDTIDDNVATAVSQTSGLVVSINDKLLNMENNNYYDYFCNIGKDVDKEEHSFYEMLQENEEERLLIPIDWAKENSAEGYNYSGKYDGQCQKDGMSLFGAKYLLNKESDAYTTIRVLRYYYGYDTTLKRVSSYSSSGCYYWPTTSTRITSSFGLRTAPTAGASTNHGAIDIGVAEGTSVFATADGTVTVAGAVNGYGYAVYIDHGNGLVSRYGHLQAGGIKVSVGQTVTAGQVIALSGNTGISTGPHLHFELRLNDVKVDPLNYVDPSNPTPTNCNIINTNGIVNTGDNAKSICLSLKNSGFTNQQIGGIMANLYSESGFNPLALNGSSGAYGIAQWLGGRKTALLGLANYTTLEVQLAFLLNELNTSESNALAYLLSGGSDANTLAGVFCNKFERPGASICTSRQNSGNGASYANFAANNCS